MRTTPPPCRDITKVVPELAKLEQTTVRLHPRRGKVADRGASKLGGDFFWPAAEPWPECKKHAIPYLGVLQLRRADVPELGFPDGADLFQLLWCPRDHPKIHMPTHRIFWRSAAEVGEPLKKIPKPILKEEDTDRDEGQYVPKPCELHPERVTEYPEFNDLPAALRQKLEKWDLSGVADMAELLAECDELNCAPGEWLYRTELSTAPGTKVGGHVEWIQEGGDPPKCARGHRMEHFLTLATMEPLGSARWCPVEDRPRAVKARGERLNDLEHVVDWEFGDGGNIYFFICRRCKDWPTETVLDCC